MDLGNGSLVGLDPDLADVLVRGLRAAETELKACAAEVAAALADVGEASFVPGEIKQVAAWCAGEAGDVARRASTARCGPTVPGHSSGPGGGMSALGGERLVNVAAPRLAEILLTPPAPRLKQTHATPPAARSRQVLGNPGAPKIPKAPCAPPVRQGPLRDLVGNGAARRSDGVTSPSRTPDPGAMPDGPRATPTPNDSDDTRRSLGAENWVAKNLAEGGYAVEQKKPVTNQKNPDYLVEGRVFDCYAPTTSNSRNIWDHVRRKVVAGQTDRVVIGLRDSTARVSDLRSQFRTWPMTGLREVLVVERNGTVIRIFP